MDDPLPIPPEGSSGTPEERSSQAPRDAASEPLPPVASEIIAPPLVGPDFALADAGNLELRQPWQGTAAPQFPPVLRGSRREFLHNLYLLLGLALAAFTLTAWILVRVQSPFDAFSTGPQQVVRAQLRALDRDELQTAYAMFSDRYRHQVTFNEWHELIVTHWRMFHVEILDVGQLAQSGSRATLVMRVRGADDKPYRARFSLIRVGGRWWVDDLHWSHEQDEGATLRT